MTKYQKASLFLLRVSIGGLFFYSGITKILDPEWTAAGYLKGADTFFNFYQALTNTSVLPVVDFLNAWGLTLIGVALILGVFVRLASFAGIILMLLYYFPALQWPFVGTHSYIVDDHIIYALALLALAVFEAGRFWGLSSRWTKLSILARHPGLKRWLA